MSSEVLKNVVVTSTPQPEHLFTEHHPPIETGGALFLVLSTVGSRLTVAVLMHKMYLVCFLSA